MLLVLKVKWGGCTGKDSLKMVLTLSWVKLIPFCKLDLVFCTIHCR